MTIWYSKKPIKAGAARKWGDYYVFTADQIHELEDLWKWCLRRDKTESNREHCEIGLAGIGRRTGRPVIKIKSTLAKMIEKEFRAVEVPDGYLQVLISLLRREYVRQDPKINMDVHPHVRKYFTNKVSSLLREIKLGKPRVDGGREPADVILEPEQLDDSTPADDPDYISYMNHKVSQIKILNSRLSNLEFLPKQIPLTEEPTDRELKSYLRLRETPEEKKDDVLDREVPQSLVERFRARREYLDNSTTN